MQKFLTKEKYIKLKALLEKAELWNQRQIKLRSSFLLIMDIFAEI